MAFVAGGKNYKAPAQSVQSFLQGTTPTLRDAQNYLAESAIHYRDDRHPEKNDAPLSVSLPSYRPGVRPATLESVLPPYVTDTLKQGEVMKFQVSYFKF